MSIFHRSSSRYNLFFHSLSIRAFHVSQVDCNGNSHSHTYIHITHFEELKLVGFSGSSSHFNETSHLNNVVCPFSSLFSRLFSSIIRLTVHTHTNTLSPTTLLSVFEYLSPNRFSSIVFRSPFPSVCS